MELRPIEDRKTWYERELLSTFPPHECKPLEDIEEQIARGCYKLIGFWEGEELLGYAGLLSRPEQPEVVLLDYLGVTAARRNGGVGSKILRQLEQMYAGWAMLLAEAEAPDGGGEDGLRRRRIGFYLRCGFRELYDVGNCGARFRALLMGPAPEDRAALAAAHRAIYGPRRTDVKIPLGPEEEPPEPPYWMKGAETL